MILSRTTQALTGKQGLLEIRGRRGREISKRSMKKEEFENLMQDDAVIASEVIDAIDGIDHEFGEVDEGSHNPVDKTHF